MLKYPPDRLHVLVLQRDVWIVHIDPEANPLRHLLPLFHVAEHALSAQIVEGRDTVLLDLAFAGEAEFLLDLKLYRKSMCIPAPLPEHMLALHRVVAREQILEHPRQYVMGSRQTVSRWRTFVKHVPRSVLAELQALGKRVLLPPQLQNFLFKLWETYL
ncbi:MAG: hypothetical protein MAG451_01875 [Anaerolineales bacterium]|nr:hypothetical protein [Anaerolineales bacterium]